MTGDAANRVLVSDLEVRGVDVDVETRCAHYGSPRDVLAIALPCCETFFACLHCHEFLADHDAEPWPETAFDAPAVLCGTCGERFAIEAHLASPLACPSCGAAFNPGCREHHHRYFDV